MRCERGKKEGKEGRKRRKKREGISSGERRGDRERRRLGKEKEKDRNTLSYI